MPSDTFIDILHSTAPASDRADKLNLYAFLVGSWETTVIAHEESGVTHTNRGEIHAGWVLEGRALQDVWMLPRRAERQPDAPRPLPVTGDWYGTTLRIYDPAIDAWHIIWSDPVKQYYSRQIGRAHGANIRQEGTDAEGTPVRWSFTRITPHSFHWLGERSDDGGKTWRLEVEFFVRRAGPTL